MEIEQIYDRIFADRTYTPTQHPGTEIFTIWDKVTKHTTIYTPPNAGGGRCQQLIELQNCWQGLVTWRDNMGVGTVFQYFCLYHIWRAVQDVNDGHWTPAEVRDLVLGFYQHEILIGNDAYANIASRLVFRGLQQSLVNPRFYLPLVTQPINWLIVETWGVNGLHAVNSRDVCELKILRDLVRSEWMTSTTSNIPTPRFYQRILLALFANKAVLVDELTPLFAAGIVSED